MLAQLTIIAPGLLGSSLGMAARERSLAKKIHVWHRRPEARDELRQAPWCDAVYETAAAAARGASLVVLCAPVSNIPVLAAEIRSVLDEKTIVTDVGSVKGELCRKAHAACAGGPIFVGSHPMAGSEKKGHEHGDVSLFIERTCFVTPLAETPKAAVETVCNFWSALGCRVTTLHPDQHDEIVAHISHLPHLLAATLCSLLSTRDHVWRDFAGPGLRDTTRVASGDPSLWRDIIDQNRDEILRALRSYENELHSIQAAVINKDYAMLISRLQRAKAYRDLLRVPQT